MDLIRELNYAIEYIEKNLTDEQALEKAAKVTSYSPYHFQRIFNYITGFPVSEYVRRRKLSLAVIDLQSGKKVIDVAMKYGYNSADSFSRAFVKQHGVLPSLINKEDVQINIYPPMEFQLTVKGIEKMTFRIETKKSFDIFGVYAEIEDEGAEVKEKVDSFKRKCYDSKIYSEMNTIFGFDSDTMLHAALFDHNQGTFKYMICQYMKDGIYVPDKYTRLHIESGMWAIFPADYRGISHLWPRIFTEWLPSSGYELKKSTAFEMYFGNKRKDDVRGEIWIPIKEIVTLDNKNFHSGLLSERREVKKMNGRFKLSECSYNEQENASLYELWKEVNNKYPNGVFWSWDPRSNEGQNMILCLENNKVIGKSHAMIFEKQEDDAPGYAEHKIFIHYRVLPEYEQNEKVLDLLYDAAFERALELRKSLSNRACQLCIGNHDTEEVYNSHILKKGWPEHGSIYHLTASTNVEVNVSKNGCTDIIFKEFKLDNPKMIRDVVINEQICFRSDISGAQTYNELAQEDYLSYGAFTKDENDNEQMVGSVIVEIDHENVSEIVSVMVLPQYRRKHIASILLQHVLEKLNHEGLDKVFLVAKCDNTAAINLYEQFGFVIKSHEKRFMKYI